MIEWTTIEAPNLTGATRDVLALREAMMKWCYDNGIIFSIHSGSLYLSEPKPEVYFRFKHERDAVFFSLKFKNGIDVKR